MVQVNALVIGGGGREHALGHQLRKSGMIGTIFFAPGNVGTEAMENCVNVPYKADDIEGLMSLARQEDILLTVVGPEKPLINGVVDGWRELGDRYRIWGPSAAAAQLEGSKILAKKLLDKYGILTAEWTQFDSAIEALTWLELQDNFDWVVKGDGLAGGKAAIVCHTKEVIVAAIGQMASFGEAGKRFIIEKCLIGREASLFLMVDKSGRVVALETAQDYKRIGDGDTGSNTGGMGAYSSASHLTPEMITVMIARLQPLIEETGFIGFLYVGIMLTDEGEFVLEFNVRMGDPETQVVVPRLITDLGEVLWAMAGNESGNISLDWRRDAVVGVVMAAGGYPEDGYKTGEVIHGLESVGASDGIVFHAGTAWSDGNVVTAGGRVLCATAFGSGIPDARKRAYEMVDKIHWNGEYHRSDIGRMIA